jgi:formylglycine-generating enzyme required for sulfatase activity
LLYGLLVSGLSLGLVTLLVPLLQPPQLTQDASSGTPPPPAPPPETQEHWTLAPLLPERLVQMPSPAPLRSLDWRDGCAVALGALLVLLGLRWWRLPVQVARLRQAQAAARQQCSALERRRLAEEAERQQAPVALTYQVERHAPLAPQAIDDAATLLGRLFHPGVSDDLDVSATVRQSVEAGGRFVPIFAARPLARELTVLVDVERGAHPWLDGITWVLERWHTLGVRLTRYDFRFDPQGLSLHRSGQPCTLRDLTRHSDGGPLLIISRTLSTQGYSAEADWLLELKVWSVKAWVDPDPRPLAERPGAARRDMRRLEQEHGLQRFPFSAAGLLALARYFAADGQGVPAPAWPTLPRLAQAEVGTALRQWALLAALVPDATWEQLEAIRRHFPELHQTLPESSGVQRLLDWVAREDRESQPESGDGRTLVLSDALVERLIRQQRGLDVGQPQAQRLEVRGRQLLLQQLEATRPDDALLAQFWDLKRVTHHLVLEPDQALTLVAPLLGSAVEPELLAVVDATLARTEATPVYATDVRHTLELLLGRALERVSPAALLGRPWRAWGLPALTTGAAVLLAGLLLWYGPGSAHTWLWRPSQPAMTTVSVPTIHKLVKLEGLPRRITNSLGMTLVLIRPGEFRMGSEAKEAFDDEKPVHTVRLTRAFYLGQYEVTQAQWQAVMGNNPSQFKGDANRPVEQVSWNDAQEFLRRLNAREGTTTYRLPSEAEWEYAARAGSTTAYGYGDDPRQLRDYAWYAENAGDTTHPVGQLKPNAWGLYDMHGNVWEWVQDWSGLYTAAAVVDPVGPAAGALRALRGGSWYLPALFVRAAGRDADQPGLAFAGFGFRAASSVSSKLGEGQGARQGASRSSDPPGVQALDGAGTEPVPRSSPQRGEVGRGAVGR